MVALDLAALLAEPSLGLEIVAGGDGIERRGVLRWAHISDIPDPTPWLEGGELVLTTGLGVKDDPDLQRALIAGLDRRGCVAVGFGLGIWLDAVPDALRDEAEARDLPLFTVPYEVPFIAVTRYVSEQVFAAHYAGLRRALDLHRRVLAVVTSDGGLDAVLAETVRSIGDVSALVFDAFGHVLARADHADHGLDADLVWRAMPPDRHTRAEVAIAGRVASVIPLRITEDVRALMVVVGTGDLDDAGRLLAQQSAAAATIELSRGLTARRARRTAVAQLLDDAQDGRASVRRLHSHLAQWGIDASRPFRVLTVLVEDARHAPVLAGLLEDMTGSDAQRRIATSVVARADAGLTSTAPATAERATAVREADGVVRAAVCEVDGLVHAVVQPADATLDTELVAAARARGLPAARIGRSAVHDTADGLARAVRQSLAAARRSTGGVRDITDLGVDGLLAGAGTDAAADALVARMLGPLLAHDQTGTALVETLRAYLDAGCRPGPAASDLRVHRHTLAYRLDRITALTGRDPRSGVHLLAYGLALELLTRRGGDG